MKVVVTNNAFSKNNYLVNQLQSHFPDAVINKEGKRYNGVELINYLQNADAAIIGLELITAEIVEALPKLKIIAKYGVGLDNIDLKACEINHIKVGWTGGVNKRSVAEMTIGFMLSLCRNLYATSNQLKNGIWNKDGGVQLSGKTVGIFGAGNIGKEVISLLQPFKCKILIYDILDLKEYADQNNCHLVSLEELIQNSDFISIHTPLTSNTQGIFNAVIFEKMKPSAFLINTARGGIVNENDLKVALLNQHIRGAALDVFETEPPVDLELLNLNNLITTPHTGGNSVEAVIAMGLSAIEHLLIFNKNND